MKSSNYIYKLGAFVVIGVLLFAITIYFIGKNRNIFGNTFELKSQFKNVSGLKVGNNYVFPDGKNSTINLYLTYSIL